MKWFRLYHDVIDDPKIGLLSESEQLLWFKLLCLASMSDDRGSIDMNDDEVCFRLRISVEFWRCVKEKFRVKGLIECGKNGAIEIRNWSKRQQDSDSSTERTQRYRQKQKAGKKKVGNVTGTSQERECDALDKIRLDPDPEEIRVDPDTHTDLNPDCVRACENFELEEDEQDDRELEATEKQQAPVQPKAIALFTQEPNELAPLSRWKPSVQSSEDRFRPPAPWRSSNRRNDYKPEFAEFVRLYLAALPSNKSKTVTLFDAKGWIAKREFDEQGLSEIEVRWEAFNSRNAAIVQSAKQGSTLQHDWENDPRTPQWRIELELHGNRWHRLNGQSDPEKYAFWRWQCDVWEAEELAQMPKLQEVRHAS